MLKLFFILAWLFNPAVIPSSYSEKVFFSFKSPQPARFSKLLTFRRNVPCRLGLSFNLTDWLPARTTDWLHITLDYMVMQDTPIKNLLDKMSAARLTSKLSLISADWAVAVKVSEIVGRLLSNLLGEG